MKKTIAAVGASVLGLGAAAAGGAIPAQAATLPACDQASDHVIDTTQADPSVNPWYMSCAPQYGMGKAEFTITTDAAHPFPAGYSLDDGHQTVTSSAPSQAVVEHYFGQNFWNNHNTFWGITDAPKYYCGLMNLNKTAGTSTSQTYGADENADPTLSVPYQISSYGKATDPFPTACTAPAGQDPSPTYQGEYEVKYVPTTVTFSETMKNVQRKVTVKYTPSPLFLGLNFDTTANDPDNVDGFDSTKALCASSGGITVQAANHDSDTESWNGVAYNASTNNASYMSTLVPHPRVDTFPQVSSSIGVYAVTTTPVLATTGVDPTAGGLAAGGLFVVGTGAVFISRRRRRRNASA